MARGFSTGSVQSQSASRSGTNAGDGEGYDENEDLPNMVQLPPESSSSSSPPSVSSNALGYPVPSLAEVGIRELEQALRFEIEQDAAATGNSSGSQAAARTAPSSMEALVGDQWIAGLGSIIEGGPTMAALLLHGLAPSLNPQEETDSENAAVSWSSVLD